MKFQENNDPIKKIYDFCAEKSIDINELLIKDINELLIPFNIIPTAPSELCILIEIYKRKKTLTDLQKYSKQSAKPLELLRKRGFILAKNNPKSKNYTTKNENGDICREIIGFQKVDNYNEAAFNISSSDRKKFIGEKSDFVTNKKIDLEIDHREPKEAIKKSGDSYPNLDSTLIDSGKADDYYQVLTRDTNLSKKSACTKCLNGDKIDRLPLIQELEILGYKYKKKFYDNSSENKKNGLPTCHGCFWFNYKKPLKIIKSKKLRQELP